jgi:ferredoxin-NADP reductase
MAFHFEKPPGFAFKAGQALAWTLIDPPETDDEGGMRNFSIASAPGEADLMIATRMRDTAFKRVLKTMPLGTEVHIVGPFGSLTLHQNTARPAVFLAGGIGITPFRSMLRKPRKPPASRRRKPKRIRWNFCKKRSARNNKRRSRKGESRARNRLYLALHAPASW